MPENSAHTTTKFSTWKDDRATDLHNKGSVQETEESQTNMPSQDTQLPW